MLVLPRPPPAAAVVASASVVAKRLEIWTKRLPPLSYYKLQMGGGWVVDDSDDGKPPVRRSYERYVPHPRFRYAVPDETIVLGQGQAEAAARQLPRPLARSDQASQNYDRSPRLQADGYVPRPSSRPTQQPEEEHVPEEQEEQEARVDRVDHWYGWKPISKDEAKRTHAERQQKEEDRWSRFANDAV